MTTDEVREKFLKFFQSKPRNHKQISPAPLVLQEDPSTLFTSSGMQPLVPYLMGEPHPEGTRLVNSQPSIRLQDIEEVGDNRHTTFFEMLGNWSLGDYWKEEQLAWFWEFLTKELKLPKERLWVSVFAGNDQIAKDSESANIWKKLGLPEKRIHFYPAGKNWWSRSGVPDHMPVNEIGGPDSEVFFEFPQVKHNPKFGKECHPNCDCGRFLEIGNSVFMQYKKRKDGGFDELPKKNIDFGGGLERIVAATLNEPDIFKINIFNPLIKIIEDNANVVYRQDEKKDRAVRIIVDHIRASVMLIVSGVIPSNKLQGYVLRRLLRRLSIKLTTFSKSDFNSTPLINMLSDEVLRIYDGNREMNIERSKQRDLVEKIITEEIAKFDKTLDRGLRVLEKQKQIDGKVAFDLHQSYGFPIELTEEIAEERGQRIDKEVFQKEFEKHQQKSRSASSGKFKGGLADHSEEVTKLHTITHLLHASLRKVLGEEVQQKGSNITAERLRFDFSHPEKLTDEQIKKVEDLINEQIEKDLQVTVKAMTFQKAKQLGALAFFGSKYGEKVKVYTIGDQKNPFSREVCGGPHVSRTSEIGRVRINKQDKVGAGVMRIYAVIEKV